MLALVTLVLLRPWERLPGGGADEAPSAGAYVIRAVDGDTIEVRIDGRSEDVRYIGIDTPETVKPDTPVQCFGHRASDFDRRLVEHRRVRLVFGVEPRDIYGRLLAYGTSAAGSENSVLRFMQTATGKDCPSRWARSKAKRRWRP